MRNDKAYCSFSFAKIEKKCIGCFKNSIKIQLRCEKGEKERFYVLFRLQLYS